MKTVKIILDFLTTIAHLFFRSRQKSKPCKPMVNDISHPVGLPPEHGSGTGSSRSDTLPIQTDTSPTPVNLLGWALIVSAASGYLLKSLLL